MKKGTKKMTITSVRPRLAGAILTFIGSAIVLAIGWHIVRYGRLPFIQ